MSDGDLTQQFVELGHISPDQIAQWTDVAGLMAIFDAIGRSGLVTMVKVDGERPNGAVYTVLITGNGLAGEDFRQDGSDLRTLLRAGVEFYRTSLSDRSQ